MRAKREEIIANYLDGYNEFDAKKMMRDFSEDIVFQNIQNGEVNMTLEGKNAFKHLKTVLILSSTLFRHRTITTNSKTTWWIIGLVLAGALLYLVIYCWRLMVPK